MNRHAFIVIGSGLLLILGSSKPVQAQEPVILTGKQGEYPLGLHLEILQDPSRQLTIDSVTSAELEAKFVRSQESVPNFGYSRFAYWVRFRVRNESSSTNNWLVALGYANMHYVDFYRPLPERSGFAATKTGLYRPVSTRELAHPLFVFSLPVPLHTEQTIYLRFENGAAMTLPLAIYSQQAFDAKSRIGHFGLGFFYGILLVMLGYNLFVFLALRDASYLYYVLFLAIIIVGTATFDGLASLYLWPDLTRLIRLTIPLAFGFGAIFFLRFAQSFLQTKSHAPKLHLLLNVLLVIWLLLLLAALFVPYGVVIAPLDLFRALNVLIALVAGIALWRHGHSPTRYFVLSFLGMLGGYLSFTLIRFGFIPSLPFTEQIYKAGVVWQVVLLSLALADRINLLKAETEKANRSLQGSENRLAQYLESMPVGVAVFDLKARVQYFNQRVLQMIGLPKSSEPPKTTLAEGLARFPIYLAGTPQPYPPANLPLTKALQGERATADDIELAVEGRRIPLEVSANPIYDERGNIQSVISVFQDITERKHAEAELKKAFREITQLKDRLQAEADYLQTELKVSYHHAEIVGESAAIKHVLGQVEQVAATGSSVLIFGETGAGKELVARAIHNLSPRQASAMVTVSCATLPSSLVESELFGREKGAYTGAMSRQIGRFEVADGSTIFLDEVGELSLEVQSKLLRVLQEGELERLGSHKTIKVDVRVIAATNRNLAEDVRQGKFREDLFYRLNVFPIQVPPLRERPEDIPLLVWAFITEFSGKMGKQIQLVPKRTMDALQRYHWPGNIRQLRNVIEHAMIISAEATLQVSLPEDPAASKSEVSSLEQVESGHIMQVLEKTHWRIKGRGGAAELLGLKPSTLYFKMRKLGIPSSREKVDILTKG